MIITVLGYDEKGKLTKAKLNLADLASKMADPVAKKQLQIADALQPKNAKTMSADEPTPRGARIP